MKAQATSIIQQFLKHKNKFHIFNSMSESEILSLIKNINFKRFKSGEVLIREGDDGEDIYYILSGRCNVVTNRKIVAEFGASSLFGELGALRDTKRAATIRAIEDTTAFTFMINKNNYEKFPISFSKYYYNVIVDLCNKLEVSNKKDDY